MNIERRYDFVFLFDVTDGNPNGDPDMGNTPRFDPETFQGLVSDVCLKRKIRNYVHRATQNEDGNPRPGYDIYVLSGQTLENRQKMAYEALSLEKYNKNDKKTDCSADIQRAKEWMCANFYDVRAFGGVMNTTDYRCGQVHGPIQITFARSFDRILITEHTITRVAYTANEKAATTTGQTEMGNKYTVAYGLYKTTGTIIPTGTGFSQEDLELFWNALINMFDVDCSASRGLMCTRGLFVFEHSNKLGNAPKHKLFDMIQVNKKEGIENPRQFSDYEVKVCNKNTFQGVKIIDKLND